MLFKLQNNLKSNLILKGSISHNSVTNSISSDCRASALWRV